MRGAVGGALGGTVWGGLREEPKGTMGGARVRGNLSRGLNRADYAASYPGTNGSIRAASCLLLPFWSPRPHSTQERNRHPTGCDQIQQTMLIIALWHDAKLR